MSTSPVEKPLVSAAEGIDPKRYSLCLCGLLGLVVSLGLQFMATAFLLWGPGATVPNAGQLTALGRLWARPEHDVVIYAAGLLLTVGTAVGAVSWWRARLARLEPAKAAACMTSGAARCVVLALASLIAFLSLLCSYWFSHHFDQEALAVRARPPTLDMLRLLLPAVGALLCLGLDFKQVFLGASSGPAGEHPLLNRVLRYGIPVLIILVLGIPPGTAPWLAGRIMCKEKLVHLNFFLMSPALLFAHGKAFGTEIYSQYGIGWPLVASALARFSALTYANLLVLQLIASCVYYIGLFFVLRFCFKQELWAALAVLLAIYWQGFSGMGGNDMPLAAPQANAMRYWMDVWFFLALMLHQRSGTLRSAAVVGVCGAVAIFFETEIGIYLTAAFLFYSVLQAGLAPSEGAALDRKKLLLPPLVAGVSGWLVLLSLLWYASRGHLFNGSFWRGWLGPLWLNGVQGFTAMPISELPDVPLVAFLAAVTLYVGVVTYALVRSLQRQASRGEVLLATVAAYGLACLLLFVNRSHPFNLPKVLVPLVVILSALACRSQNILCAAASKSLAGVSVAGLILLLLTKPEFRRYPSLAGALFDRTPHVGLALRSNPDDLWGLPREYEARIRDYQAVVAALRALAPDGRDVAVLDSYETMLYSLADATPWSRTASLFQMAFTRQDLEEIGTQLIERAPKYVCIYAPNAQRPPEWEFIWRPLYQVVTNWFVLRQTAGSFEFWGRPETLAAGSTNDFSRQHIQLRQALDDYDGAVNYTLVAQNFIRQRNFSAAIEQYREALRLNPNSLAALNNLAWLHATRPEPQFRDGAEAVRLAERACQQTDYKQFALMCTLAAAYAEAGRFEEAVAAAEKASGLALAGGNQQLAEQEQKMLRLFKARQPYRDK